MAWRIEFDESGKKDLARLDPQVARRITAYLRERLVLTSNPREIGEALRGERFGEYWKYRVGDTRVVAKLEDGLLRILVVRIGHRREVYR